MKIIWVRIYQKPKILKKSKQTTGRKNQIRKIPLWRKWMKLLRHGWLTLSNWKLLNFSNYRKTSIIRRYQIIVRFCLSKIKFISERWNQTVRTKQCELNFKFLTVFKFFSLLSIPCFTLKGLVILENRNSPGEYSTAYRRATDSLQISKNLFSNSISRAKILMRSNIKF